MIILVVRMIILVARMTTPRGPVGAGGPGGPKRRHFRGPKGAHGAQFLQKVQFSVGFHFFPRPIAMDLKPQGPLWGPLGLPGAALWHGSSPQGVVLGLRQDAGQGIWSQTSCLGRMFGAPGAPWGPLEGPRHPAWAPWGPRAPRGAPAHPLGPLGAPNILPGSPGAHQGVWGAERPSFGLLPKSGCWPLAG